jgi:hypothetical protein
MRAHEDPQGLPGSLLAGSVLNWPQLSFTGSTKTGRAVACAAANSNLKSVTLELCVCPSIHVTVPSILDVQRGQVARHRLRRQRR